MSSEVTCAAANPNTLRIARHQALAATGTPFGCASAPRAYRSCPAFASLSATHAFKKLSELPVLGELPAAVDACKNTRRSGIPVPASCHKAAGLSG